jgi:hypothetical protein
MDANITNPKAKTVAAPQPKMRRRLIMPVRGLFWMKFHMDATMSPKKARPASQNRTLARTASGRHRTTAVITKLPRRQIYTSAGHHQLLKYRVSILFIISLIERVPLPFQNQSETAVLK